MIKGITGGNHIIVDSGYSSMPSFYNNVGKELVGQMKYNSSSQNIEVWDGNSWQVISGAHPTIRLSPIAQTAMDWAIKKMAEEDAWLKNDHPAVKAAYENFQRARQQLEVTATLAKDQEQTKYHPV